MIKKLALFLLAVVSAIWLAWWLATKDNPRYDALSNPSIKFAEVQINSDSPKQLSEFYQRVFDARKVDFDVETKVQNHATNDIALWAPGYHKNGPILTFKGLPANADNARRGPLTASDHGYAHLCFEADDVGDIVQRIQLHGGNIISRYEDPSREPVVYAQDPDGNVIEVHVPLPSPTNPSTLTRFVKSLINSFWGTKLAEQNLVRFLHVNINSNDWQQTAKFYESVFGATATGRLRDYQGEFIENLTNIDGAIVKGRHLAAPGYHPGGPTLEMFTYANSLSQGPLAEQDKGVVAIGFHVVDLEATVQSAIKHGATVVRRDQSKQSILINDPNNNFIQIRAIR